MEVEALWRTVDLRSDAQLFHAFEESKNVELEGGDIDGVSIGGNGTVGEELGIQLGSRGGESGGRTGRFVLDCRGQFKHSQELIEGESGEESDA